MKVLCLLLAVFSVLACSRDPYGHKHALYSRSNCFGSFKDSWLRQFAKHFVSQDQNGREKLFEFLEASIDHAANTSTDLPLHKLQSLHAYFADIESPSLEAHNGANLPFRQISDDVLVIELTHTNIAPAEHTQWPKLNEVYWNWWPIPVRNQVKNYPLYRGDDVFTQMSYSRNILAEDSPLWPRLRDLFSKGMYINQSSLPLHQDVYEHTIDSSSSKFISSSKDFYVALDFGRNQKIGWSAVLEFRGEGVDVVATGKYFATLPFLNAMPALMPREKEVAIAYGVQAHNIRGIWLVDASGRVVFIANPNFRSA